MANSSRTFAESIKDAENLLAHFEALNSHPPPDELEVLKRAGLIMAMTAWETYVEDRIYRLTTERLLKITDQTTARFVKSRLEEELKRFHNPDSTKTIALFHDFAGIDLQHKWCWNNFEAKTVRSRLDQYLKLRGEVVHRSRAAESSRAHPVKKEELEKAISFLKNLVGATELAIEEQSTD